MSRVQARAFLIAGAMFIASFLSAAECRIQLPLERTAYQTNETIDLAVVRTSDQALAAGDLVLTLTGSGGSRITASFAVPGAPLLDGQGARRTEHVHLNGRLLRPGDYVVEASVDGATARAQFALCSHIRKSSFRLIDWGTKTRGPQVRALGEESMGFNLLLASHGGHDQSVTIRGGLDYIRCCTLGGGHQMDLRLECDWSDPYVLAGGAGRASWQAFKDRTSPNVMGVHFYDEPGLTWWVGKTLHPKTGEATGHGIPAQERAFRAAFDREPPFYKDVKADDPASVAAWAEWARWKQVFMDASWKYCAYATSRVRPDLISCTQSVYGWLAFGDGYYFNVTRSLPVVSGHGGYDDYAGGYVNPGLWAEYGRARNLHTPFWYLPGWWKNPPDRFRLEQYLTFMINVQGLCAPPTAAYGNPKDAGPMLEAVVESNQLMARLGTIFTTMPVTRPPAALLYSMSENIHQQVRNMGNFQDFGEQVDRMHVMMFASKRAGIPLLPVVEEDVLDGTLAANHKAVFLTGIHALDPEVVNALAAFAAHGGAVILGDECTVDIPGARKLGATVSNNVYQKAAKEFAKGGPPGQAAGKYARRPNEYFLEAEAATRALRERCQEIGIQPVAQRENEWVFLSRQAQGDFEYLFLVNAEQDVPGADMNSIKAATATVAGANDGRSLYDAVHGGPAVGFAKEGETLTARLTFGPGQMRVYARSARPIGSVVVLPPVVQQDFVQEADPVHVAIAAMLVDDQGLPLVGAVPLEIRVRDPRGAIRYHLYRATDASGLCRLVLPLAANDAAGEWTVTVRDGLAKREGAVKFRYQPAAQCGAVAGASRRAVFFGSEAENIYRFFRQQKNVTLVIGTAAYERTQAERLARILAPWDVTCEIREAAAIKPNRELPAEAKATWTDRVSRADTGFDLRGPAILLGTPEDNPLIRFLAVPGPADRRFLPYQPGPAQPPAPPAKGKKPVPSVRDFPGRGRGYLAWQANAIGLYSQESITLIAYDEEGLSEAVGTLFELASGFDPLTRFLLPRATSLAPAQTVPGEKPGLRAAWQVVLPDRAVQGKAENNEIELLSLDGTLTRLGADGKVLSQEMKDARAAQTAYNTSKPAPAESAAHQVDGRVVKHSQAGGERTAVAYWGGLLRLFDAKDQVLAEQQLAQDVAGLLWVGETLVVSLADGTVLGLRAE